MTGAKEGFWGARGRGICGSFQISSKIRQDRAAAGRRAAAVSVEPAWHDGRAALLVDGGAG